MLSLHYLALCVLCILLPHSLCTPVASPNPKPAALPDPLTSFSEFDTIGNGYTGQGGNASGGSVTSSTGPASLLDAVTGGKSILSLDSENAGDGGNASSGRASSTRNLLSGGLAGGRPFGGGVLSGILVPATSNGNIIVPIGRVANGVGPNASVPLTGPNADKVALSSTTGNAYSGTGGTATGGDVNTPSSLIELFSHNAGQGGKANSGASSVMRRQLLGKSRFEKFEDGDVSGEVPSHMPSVERRKPLRPSRAFRAI